MSLADKWILSRLNNTIEAVTRSLENYRFNEGESILYDFFWHEFCDWYVEMVKPEITGRATSDERRTTENVLIDVLENSLKLLHPFMPFVTEAVWQNIGGRESIMIESWPKPDKSYTNKNIERNMGTVKDIIISIRNIRSDMDILYTKKLRAYLVPLKKGGERSLKGGIDYITHLAKLEELIIDRKMRKPEHCATSVLEGFNIFIPLEGVIDVKAEKARLIKKREGLEKQLKFSERKLKDRNFITKAPEKIINLEKEKSEKLKGQIKRLKETLKGL